MRNSEAVHIFLTQQNFTALVAKRRKIINDPVYGFITIRHPFLLELIDHPYFQRLRRISQLGLSHLVYPGAHHNRFQHAIGAMYLMQNVIDEIRLRGHEITVDEEEGLLCAVVLHDIGHGPFSHALEHAIVEQVHHEQISSLMMDRLNEHFEGRLSTAIRIFNNQYPKQFMHQLVSSQLDMDRMDYLARDSFFSGVVEGQVGSERLIKMIDVVDDALVVEEKGIYSIEKFIVARRFMYWQVYLHKTVLSAEWMLLNALRRAKRLAQNGELLFCSPVLHHFLYEKITLQRFHEDLQELEWFARLDDYDIMGALKVWQDHQDHVLADLSRRLVSRDLFRIELQKVPFEEAVVEQKKQTLADRYGLSEDEMTYYFIQGKVDNKAYDKSNRGIMVKMKDGSVMDAADASDHLNLAALSTPVEKHFICYPKG
jgi:uncharacterized protein